MAEYDIAFRDSVREALRRLECASGFLDTGLDLSELVMVYSGFSRQGRSADALRGIPHVESHPTAKGVCFDTLGFHGCCPTRLLLTVHPCSTLTRIALRGLTDVAFETRENFLLNLYSSTLL